MAPGQGRTMYWWGVYHDRRVMGATKTEAARSASIAEKHHKAKRKKTR